MRSNLIFRKAKGRKPSAVHIRFQIDECRQFLEEVDPDEGSILESIWYSMDDHLASWEKQMHNQKSDEPIF